MIGLQDTHSNFLNCLIGEKRCFFRLLLDFVYFITGLMFTIFFFFISLLDAFDFADTNTMQDVSRIIYETRTELVHSRESLSQSVGTRNPKVWDLIPRGKSKFSFSYACNEAQKCFYSFSVRQHLFQHIVKHKLSATRKPLRNVHNQRNKDLHEQFTVLKKCRRKFECLF